MNTSASGDVGFRELEELQAQSLDHASSRQDGKPTAQFQQVEEAFLTLRAQAQVVNAEGLVERQSREASRGRLSPATRRPAQHRLQGSREVPPETEWPHRKNSVPSGSCRRVERPPRSAEHEAKSASPTQVPTELYCSRLRYDSVRNQSVCKLRGHCVLSMFSPSL